MTQHRFTSEEMKARWAKKKAHRAARLLQIAQKTGITKDNVMNHLFDIFENSKDEDISFINVNKK